MGSKGLRGRMAPGRPQLRPHAAPGHPRRGLLVRHRVRRPDVSLLRSPREFPSLSSKRGGLEENPGGGFDIFFGPTPAPGAPEGNWVQTDPAGSLFLTLRLYGPGARFFDGSWRPGEPVNTTPRN